MINNLSTLLKIVLLTIPFVLFALLNKKANLKKKRRYRQLPMVVIAFLYCVVFMFLIDKVSEWVFSLLNLLPGAFRSVAEFFKNFWDGKLSFLGDAAAFLSDAIQKFLRLPEIRLILFLIVNALIMLAHILVKRILISLMSGLFSKNGGFYDRIAGLFYDYDNDNNVWYIRPRLLQGRTFLKTLYWGALVITTISIIISAWLFRNDLLAAPFYPVFGLIIIGELYFAIDGLTKKEAEGSLSGEAENRRSVVNYSLLRPILRKLFGDKLVAEDTTVRNELAEEGSVEASIGELQESTDEMEEAYGFFMQKKTQQGLIPDQNYIVSGKELLQGKSILFNNPFYYDLIPYAFYAMNRVLLKKEKVLIVLGRHNTEEDIARWCEAGLRSVTNISEMWNIGVLSHEKQALDVGILTRSSLHDQKLLECNRDFFRDMHFAVLIEPSRLLTTAQIGLNSLLNLCRREDKTITFCSTDKNCDGLVDALSHLLMTSISEVSATKRHDGACSYMCWETDEENWQHRMLPNLSRYLGVGTELSFAALKNQVKKTFWYGGDAFPVVDIRWIANQYYYDLLHYAELPISQDTMDKVFEVSPNLWDMKKEENAYLTVEDEACNMFEIKRAFSTRSSNQNFINVISPEYLLKDYMAKNNTLFNSDPKAIPYIVADYARTPRNVVLRLCLRMSAGYVPESDVRREMLLIDAETEKILESFWHCICSALQPVGEVHYDEELGELLKLVYEGKELTFDKSIIETKRQFSMENGSMETNYRISDNLFRMSVLGDLQNASYIAEEENGDALFLGSELRGHIFQKYLPGQFFTFSGKYYEMLSVTSDGKILLRRAADHINGRQEYRQVRHYRLHNVKDASGMGDIRTSYGMRISRQFADISVETPAYLRLNRYNDFEKGDRIEISGIPVRHYYNKQMLKINFLEYQDLLTPEIKRTLVLLMNEVLRTILAENHDYLTVLLPEPSASPLTHDLSGADGFEPDSSAIYIVEDSQLDIGLLVAVERNLDRIFSIIFDYLDWHLEELDKSLHPVQEAEPDYSRYAAAQEKPEEEKEKKGCFGWLKRRKKKGTKKGAEEGEAADSNKEAEKEKKGCFGWLKKDKKEEEEPQAEQVASAGDEPQTEQIAMEGDESQAAEMPSEGETPQIDAEQAQPEENKEKKKGLFSRIFGRKKNKEASEPEPEEQEQENLPLDDKADSPESVAAGEISENSEEAEDSEEIEEQEDKEDKGFNLPFMLFNVSPVIHDDQDMEEQMAKLEGELTSESKAEQEEVPRPVSQTSDNSKPSSDTDTNHSFEFERDGSSTVKDSVKQVKPYHERYYLLFGAAQISENLDPDGTKNLLRAMGFSDGFLQQARKGDNLAKLIEQNYNPADKGKHYCDFCGKELSGTEYDMLADGRERCSNCSRTAVKTEEEFVRIFDSVNRNMEAYFGIRIKVPVKVSMVNSRKLHKKLGKSFVPSAKPDGRTLGVAIREKDKYSLLVENGSPRVTTATTMAHELTHIWQYTNWDMKAISQKYGSEELEVYEGMARWVEIQYAYLVGETAAGKRLEIATLMQNDEYGRGFIRYGKKYPLSLGSQAMKDTPFEHKDTPI